MSIEYMCWSSTLQIAPTILNQQYCNWMWKGYKWIIYDSTLRQQMFEPQQHFLVSFTMHIRCFYEFFFKNSIYAAGIYVWTSNPKCINIIIMREILENMCQWERKSWLMDWVNPLDRHIRPCFSDLEQVRFFYRCKHLQNFQSKYLLSTEFNVGIIQINLFIIQLIKSTWSNDVANVGMELYLLCYLFQAIFVSIDRNQCQIRPLCIRHIF